MVDIGSVARVLEGYVGKVKEAKGNKMPPLEDAVYIAFNKEEYETMVPGMEKSDRFMFDKTVGVWKYRHTVPAFLSMGERDIYVPVLPCAAIAKGTMSVALKPRAAQMWQPVPESDALGYYGTLRLNQMRWATVAGIIKNI